MSRSGWCLHEFGVEDPHGDQQLNYLPKDGYIVLFGLWQVCFRTDYTLLEWQLGAKQVHRPHR